jgi:hypothetical protein
MVKGLLENVFVRLAIYITSALPGLLAGVGIGWVKIKFDGVDWVSIHFSIAGFSTMVAGAIGLSGGVFGMFGKK